MKTMIFFAAILAMGFQSALADSDFDPLVAGMANEMSPEYANLKRDVYVYHWTKRSVVAPGAAGSIPWDSASSADYTQRKILWTYRPDKTGFDALGVSLYASADPRSTDNFGDSVVETRLPEKMSYLDERKPVPFSPELIARLAQAGCQAKSFSEMMKQGNPSRCHEIGLRLLEVLHISAVLYPFTENVSSLCPDRAQAGFMIVNPSLGKTDYSHYFVVGDLPQDAGNAERARIQDVWKSVASQSGDFTNLSRQTLWPSMGPSADSAAWAGDHLFGCNLAKHPEDAIPDGKTARALPALDFSARVPDRDHMPDVISSCLPAGNDVAAPVRKTYDSMKAVLPNGGP